jgi:hypothetical protein
MRRIDSYFLLLAATCLIVGVVMGIVMGIAHAFQFAPVHAHFNLVGWASLALFGLVYKAYPALGQSRLALAHFWLSGPTALLFPIGIYLAMSYEFLPLAVGASLLWLAGAALFLGNLVRIFLFASAPLRAGEAREALA